VQSWLIGAGVVVFGGSFLGHQLHVERVRHRHPRPPRDRST